MQSGERELERLGNCDVPRVVTCRVVTQFPDAAGEESGYTYSFLWGKELLRGGRSFTSEEMIEAVA